MTEVEDPEGAPESLHAPSGGNGFDAPPSTRGLGAQGRSEARAGRRGAGSNGHHAPVTPGTPVGLRGRWIVPLAVVSAITGMCMFLGVAASSGIAWMAGLRDIQVLAPAFLGLMLGGLAGVWLGARIAVRLTGEDPEGRLVLTGIFGTAGLALGLGLLILAARVDVIVVAGLGLIAPGIGAAIGDRIALARKMQARPKGS